ncbi:PRC-barrel domain-containing protein [Psychromarinibacter sp. S121]|uniref:PRC-barrel domain-containing protein n=1 Tax=Psychromarinibacter sp. S121 TaxID=3415127 RepID=UPI003C7D639F
MYRTTLIAMACLAAQPLMAQDDTATETPPPVIEDSSDGDMASDTAPAEEPAGMMHNAPLIAAGALDDAAIYSLGETYDQAIWDSGEPFGPITTGWNEIGDVEDVVLDSSAMVVGVTVDVGGFLGIGQTTVLLPTDDLRLVQTPEDGGFYIVTRMSREQIEDAEEIDTLLGED